MENPYDPEKIEQRRPPPSPVEKEESGGCLLTLFKIVMWMFGLGMLMIVALFIVCTTNFKWGG